MDDDDGQLFNGLVLWPDAVRGPWAVVVEWRMQYGVPIPVGLQIRSYQNYELLRHGSAQVLPRALDGTPFPRLEGQTIKKLPFSEILRGTLAAAVAEAKLNLIGIDERVRAHEEDGEPLPDLLVLMSPEEMRERLSVVVEAGGGGPKGRDLGDAHYAEVAVVYKAAAGTRAPTKAVAEHFGIEKSSAAKQVARARARGFLPKTTRGRIGRGEESPG